MLSLQVLILVAAQKLGSHLPSFVPVLRKCRVAGLDGLESQQNHSMRIFATLSLGLLAIVNFMPDLLCSAKYSVTVTHLSYSTIIDPLV